jgi:uncharacterized protein
MRLSRYIQKLEVEPGVIGAYSPFGHEVTFLSKREWSFIEKGCFNVIDQRIMHDLVNRKFLVRDDFELHILEQYRPAVPGIREMWLIVQQSCNMSCQYCVVEGNVEDAERRRPTKAARELKMFSPAQKPSLDSMPPDIAEAAIRRFAEFVSTSKPSNPRVTLYGGEPLLNLATIRHAIPLIRAIEYDGQNRPQPVQALVITNGQIYDPDLTQFFKKHRVSVSVSVDGLKHHHDAVRVSHGGKGTFDQAVSSLRKYKAAGLNVGVCTTIGKHNVDDLPAIADFFADELGVSVELQVPFQIPFDGGNRYYVPMKEAAAKSLEAFSRMRRKGFIEGLTMRRLIQFARGEFHHRDCSAVGGQWVIAPDGMVGPCHTLVGERNYFDGDVRDQSGDPYKSRIFREWWQRMPINMPDCHGCPAIAICGGGCPYNAMVSKGSIWSKDPQQCDYMFELINWLITDMWGRYKSLVNFETVRPGIGA